MKNSVYKHKVVGVLTGRLKESRSRIQIILGPRQVGKSWAINDVLHGLSSPYVYALADSEKQMPGVEWITRHWYEARDKEQEKNPGHTKLLLIILIVSYNSPFLNPHVNCNHKCDKIN